MKQEFAIMWTAYPDVIHRGPYKTFAQAQDWLDEAKYDGLNIKNFYIVTRQVSDWERA